MNYIFKYGKNFAAISDSVKADLHKHWMIQMLISSQGNLDIQINGKKISCKGVVVDINTMHEFYTGSEIHLTLLIDPTTEIGRIIRGNLLQNQSYYVFPDTNADVLQQDLQKTILLGNTSNYVGLVQSFFSKFQNDKKPNYDERINRALELLESCSPTNENHQVTLLASQVYLSESRLSHLFKEQTGIPLKSYLVLHKLQEAYDYILNGMCITEAAITAGFDSSAHLAYTNKKMTGMSTTNIIKDSVFLKVPKVTIC